MYTYVGHNPINYIDPTGYIPSTPDGSATEWSSEDRMDFVGQFFMEFSGLDWYEWYDRWLSNGYGHGRAIIDFMQWETDSGRLDNSDWWRSVNGGMIDHMRDAWIAWDNGDRTSDNSLINGWLTYMASPTQANMWTAHNEDIAAGFKENTALLANEGPDEALFAMGVTARVLRMAPSVQSDPWWDITGLLSTQGPLLDWVTRGTFTDYFVYPASYPIQTSLPSTEDIWWYLGR